MKFTELDAKQKIQIVKDEFVKLVETLAIDPAQIKKYITNEDTASKLQSILSNVKKKEGCICGTCVDYDFTSGSLHPEFEMLIDVARTEAESKSF